MTEYEIASAIENYVTSHRGVTDFPLAQLQVRDEVNTLRLRLFDELEKGNNSIYNIAPYTQTITVLPKRENGGMFVDIPYIHVRGSGKVAADFIGSASGDTPFKIVTGDRRVWAQYDTHTGKAPTAVYNNGRLEFLNTAPRKVLISAVFNKPSELRKYGYDWKNTQYPVPYSVIDTIIGKSAESYLRTRQQTIPHPNNQSDIDAQGSSQLKVN